MIQNIISSTAQSLKSNSKSRSFLAQIYISKNFSSFKQTLPSIFTELVFCYYTHWKLVKTNYLTRIYLTWADISRNVALKIKSDGVSLFVSNRLNYTLRNYIKLTNDFNIVSIEIMRSNLNTNKNLIVSAVYWPPNTSIE